jgi:transporter family protein
MESKHIALWLGGALPAVMLGVSGLLQKLSTSAGISPGVFLLATGAMTALTGLVFLFIQHDAACDLRSLTYACLYGLVWSTSLAFISIALRRFGGQLSQLAALYNMNTLVAVLLGLLVLSEWRSVSPTRITAAAVLIVLGGVLAARS